MPPLLKKVLPEFPPQIIIFLPVKTAECPLRAEGAPLLVIVDHATSAGLYLTPVFKGFPVREVLPPQMIISAPVKIAV